MDRTPDWKLYIGGEVTDEMGRVMRADEMRVRRPAEEVMRANPVPGGGVMGMLEPGEMEVLRGHPFQRMRLPESTAIHAQTTYRFL